MFSQETVLKKFVYALADTALAPLATINSRRFTSTPPIIVAGTGRGGTTFLAEALCELFNRQMIWEPLLPTNNRRCQKHGFGWHHYFDVTTDNKLPLAYLERIVSGRELRLATLHRDQVSIGSLLRTGGYLVKFVNANTIIRWMCEQLDTRATLIIRHPCATISSQIVHGRWSSTSDHINSRILEKYPAIAAAKSATNPNSLEECLSLHWVLNTLLPITPPIPANLQVIPYENLVTDPASAIRTIANHYGLDSPAPKLIKKVCKKPSATVADEEPPALNKWRKHLSENQVQSIFKVVEAAGIDIYQPQSGLPIAEFALAPST